VAARGGGGPRPYRQALGGRHQPSRNVLGRAAPRYRKAGVADGWPLCYGVRQGAGC
jgi:hypothetical protein